jgi:ubiquinone/menaquinone biosynthesis C-methylase UbiE
MTLLFNRAVDVASGHRVLAATGKTVLRPGGMHASSQLLEWSKFCPGDRVLVLNAGVGNSAIALAKRHRVRVIGLEQNASHVAIAQRNIRKANLSNQVQIYPGSIEQLRSLSQSFDYILAETLLTFHANPEKHWILKEVWHSLKPGGYLLGHELMVANGLGAEIHRVLAEMGRINVTPLARSEWLDLYQNAGLQLTHCATGEIDMLAPRQIVRDEGWARTGQIFWNILTQKTLRDRIATLQNILHNYAEMLGYIVVCAQRV